MIENSKYTWKFFKLLSDNLYVVSNMWKYFEGIEDNICSSCFTNDALISWKMQKQQLQDKKFYI
jgi:hypothetical protein